MYKKEGFRCKGCIGIHAGCNLVAFDPQENDLVRSDGFVHPSLIPAATF